jgi:hypothetical protein
MANDNPNLTTFFSVNMPGTTLGTLDADAILWQMTRISKVTMLKNSKKTPQRKSKVWLWSGGMEEQPWC